MRASEGERGQAAVELVAVLPVLALVTLIALQLALAGFGLWTSANASRAAARAEHVGGNPRQAARSAVPAPFRRGLSVRTAPARVRLRVPALLPGVRPIPVRARSALLEERGG